MDDYYRPLSHSPLAEFIVDSTRNKQGAGHLPGLCKAAESNLFKKQKATVKSEGSHRHLFSLAPAKLKLTCLISNGKAAHAEARSL